MLISSTIPSYENIFKRDIFIYYIMLLLYLIGMVSAFHIPPIAYQTVLDLAKLNILMYEYGTSFELQRNQSIEQFASNYRNLNYMDTLHKRVLRYLSVRSPNGQVEKFISDTKTDLQAGIALSTTNKRITVVFRGTDSLQDWAYNVHFVKKHISDGIRVHKGFYQLLHTNHVFETLSACLHDLSEQYPEYDIYVTGHSLGSALATIFGFEYACSSCQNVIVVSFASPRVGNKAFRKSFDSIPNLKHYRISNARDIVTAIPFGFNYQHVGYNIHVDDKVLRTFPNYDYLSTRYSILQRFSIPDHDIDRYYENLCNNPW